MTNMNQGVREFRETPGAVLIDLRDKADYDRGHIPGAVHSMLSSIREEVMKLARFSTPIFLYCYTGSRSAQAEALLKSKGYEKALSLGSISAYSGTLEGPRTTIKKLRKELGLTQAQFASAIGTCNATVGHYETGRMEPSLRVLERIRKTFGAEIAVQGKISDASRVIEQRDGMTIRELRMSQGLSQMELARILGCSQGLIGHYETGRVFPSEKMLVRIKKQFGVRVIGTENREKGNKPKKPAAEKA